MTGHLLSRRGSMTVMGLGAGALLAPSAVLGAVPAADDDLRTYLRIRSRLDGKPAFYPYQGTIYGKPFGKVAVPLFDVEGFSWDRLTQSSDGHYRIDTYEAGYFLDRATGLPLSTWVNPLNGVTTQVKHYRSSAHIVVSNGKLEPVVSPTAVPALALSASMSAMTRMNGKIWVHEDIIAQIANKPQGSFADAREYAGPTLEATSLATWSADLADLADRRRAFVPAMFSYQTLGTWRPFMRMGTTPGVISWRLFGTKEPSLDRVPAGLRTRILREYPDFLAPKA